uniref:Charged multivesicular body protein 4b n=1 Tax=Lygus hesperus TaxID=30085 RepID=A0A0K8TJP7_LYGHE
MSPFKNLFKKRESNNEDKKSPTNAISELRKMEELLNKKQEFLEHKVRQEMETVKANGRTNKRVALLALKKKKRYELQLQQIDGTLTTIEMQRKALESATRNTTILTTMKQAADTLKKTYVKVDDVHEMLMMLLSSRRWLRRSQTPFQVLSKLMNWTRTIFSRNLKNWISRNWTGSYWRHTSPPHRCPTYLSLISRARASSLMKTNWKQN